MRNDKFRIGLSPATRRPDGRPVFPSYDLSPLAKDPRVEIAYFEAKGEVPAAAIRDFDALVLMGERITPASFEPGMRLAHLARMGVGFDTIDLAACTANGVALTNTPPAVRRPMAVATLTYLLALAGNLFLKDRITREGPAGWAKRIDCHGTGLIGRTLGIVGLGNIGSEVARLVKPLELRLIGHDPYVRPEHARALGVELAPLDELFRQADFVSLNCPLTEETRHLANERRLRLMKPTAYLINTARGPVVDQKAIHRALTERWIAGAALDVLDPEPSAADEPLHKVENVILAPHALGWTDQMFQVMAEVNRAALAAVMDGRAPDHVVNAEVLNAPAFQAKLKARAG
jgi:phosphoglycerate dehydrogenase-like enzyme